MNNYHKTKLLNGVIFINSAIIFSCGLYVIHVMYLIQISTDNK